MEVGAVKQAFNNEVIQLKRNLNQAKIQTIHKLTRKAKTFAEKKAPEKLKEKLKRKAESAVNEVLLIKKIKPRDIARFTVTHTGNLQDYLNKPTIDQDKACARLLLHKSLQGKYTLIRNRFSSIPIKDLLMSRQERRKLKREALLDKRMKKDKKQRLVNAEGEWDVENIKTGKINDGAKNTRNKFNVNEMSEDDDDANYDNEGANSDADEGISDDGKSNSDEEADSDYEVGNVREHKESEDESLQSDEEEQSEEKGQSDEIDSEDDANMETLKDSDENLARKSGDIAKLKKGSQAKVDIRRIKPALTFEQLGKNRINPEMKGPSKPKDVHKNKNLNEKLQSRKFKKGSCESQLKETKVVDPFFITSTGENYMSLAEPRQPDEFKEIHRQGNRKERRAAMFGHVPKVKPRQEFRQNNFSKQNESSSGYRQKLNHTNEGSFNNNYRGRDSLKSGSNSQFRGQKDKFQGRNDRQFEGKNNQIKGRNDKLFEGRNDKFKGRNDFKGRNNDMVEPKVEKLHPSWEAKKKQSGILPFQGKKIVFDES